MHTGASDRKLFRRRKKIVDHVVTESNTGGCPPEDIVEELDKLRLEKSMSFTALEALLSTVEAQLKFSSKTYKIKMDL